MFSIIETCLFRLIVTKVHCNLTNIDYLTSYMKDLVVATLSIKWCLKIVL